jgi:hypothetical protein
MKLRVRQLANDQWILEARRWHQFAWRGARIDRSQTTPCAAAAGVFDLPRLAIEAPDSIHYPLTWHSSKDSAIAAFKDARALLGA